MSGLNDNTCVHNEFSSAKKLAELVQKANEKEIAEVQATNTEILKKFSDALRSVIKADVTRSKFNFSAFTDTFRKVRLSLPNNSLDSRSNDVTLEVGMKDRVFYFEYELKFREYASDDSKSIKLVGMLDNLFYEDCEDKVEDVMYRLYKSYVASFASISSASTYDTLFEEYQRLAKDYSTCPTIDISKEILDSLHLKNCSCDHK